MGRREKTNMYFFKNVCLTELITLRKYFQIFQKDDKGLKCTRKMAKLHMFFEVISVT